MTEGRDSFTMIITPEYLAWRGVAKRDGYAKGDVIQHDEHFRLVIDAPYPYGGWYATYQYIPPEQRSAVVVVEEGATA